MAEAARPGPGVIGVLNVTPDSFSDGGLHLDQAAAIAAGRAMMAAGAAMLDVGAESTRPGALEVDPAVEQARLLPVVRALVADGVKLSVDTRHAATMACCLDAGAAMINDVSALRFDPGAAGVIAARGARVILMHMRGTPADMDRHAVYGDVVAEVAAELGVRRDAAIAAGIAPENIWLDPGIGFAKTAAHNLALLGRLEALASLGCPLVVGASRKRFIAAVAGPAAPRARLGGSIAAAIAAASGGADWVRVHDVAETVQALAVAGAIRASRAAMAASCG